MLRACKNLFGKLLTNNSEDSMMKILEELIENRFNLSIYLDHRQAEKGGYGSTLVNFSYRGTATYLVLDEVTPRDGMQLIKPDMIISVESFEDGIFTNFDLRVFKEEDNLIYCHLPERIIRHQKRNTGRVTIKHQELYSIAIYSDNRLPIHAEPRDISDTGMRLQLPTTPPISPPLMINERFDRCHLIIPGQDAIQFGLELRHIKLNSNRKHLTLGAKFMHFKTEIHHQNLKHLIYHLQSIEKFSSENF